MRLFCKRSVNIFDPIATYCFGSLVNKSTPKTRLSNNTSPSPTSLWLKTTYIVEALLMTFTVGQDTNKRWHCSAKYATSQVWPPITIRKEGSPHIFQCPYFEMICNLQKPSCSKILFMSENLFLGNRNSSPSDEYPMSPPKMTST